MKFFQVFDLLQFVNMDLPSNYLHVIRLFDENLFDVAPNPFSLEHERICRNFNPLYRDLDK